MKRNAKRRLDSVLAKKSFKTTTLRLESLEARELLSVAPGSEFLTSENANIRNFISGPFTVDEARAAYESSVATRADDVINIAEISDLQKMKDVFFCQFHGYYINVIFQLL